MIEIISYKNGLEDDIVRSKITDGESETIKSFCHRQLELVRICADCKEFLQRTLMVCSPVKMAAIFELVVQLRIQGSCQKAFTD